MGIFGFGGGRQGGQAREDSDRLDVSSTANERE
jgi:hypothetical protein